MRRRVCWMVLAAFGSANAFSASLVVDMKNKAFSSSLLKVKQGDKVTFRNMDPFNHDVFSLSDTQSFDLGSYPQGLSRTVTMSKPGMVEVECSIHPNMKMRVEVQ